MNELNAVKVMLIQHSIRSEPQEWLCLPSQINKTKGQYNTRNKLLCIRSPRRLQYKSAGISTAAVA